MGSRKCVQSDITVERNALSPSFPMSSLKRRGENLGKQERSVRIINNIRCGVLGEFGRPEPEKRTHKNFFRFFQTRT